MKKFIFSILVVGCLVLSSGTSAQRATPPANVPPNPNWVVTNWGEAPAGKDWKRLRSVDSVTYDPHGKGSIVVLVSPVDRADPAVWVFDYDGHFQRAWGANMFTRPYDLVIDRLGYLWIAGEMENFVAKFTEDGKQVMMLGKRAVAGDNASRDLFNGPTDVAVAKNGDFFVTDGYQNSRVVKFDKNGKFLMIIGGTKGSEVGQFNLPHRVLID
jgi:DNA-binding beta-propeller fold protein YncE